MKHNLRCSVEVMKTEICDTKYKLFGDITNPWPQLSEHIAIITYKAYYEFSYIALFYKINKATNYYYWNKLHRPSWYAYHQLYLSHIQFLYLFYVFIIDDIINVVQNIEKGSMNTSVTSKTRIPWNLLDDISSSSTTLLTQCRSRVISCFSSLNPLILAQPNKCVSELSASGFSDFGPVSPMVSILCKNSL